MGPLTDPIIFSHRVSQSLAAEDHSVQNLKRNLGTLLSSLLPRPND